MKKKVLILTAVFSLLLTGCGKTKSEQIESKYGTQNETITKSLNDLKITETENFSGLMILDDNTLYTQLGITVDDVQNYVGALPYVLDSKFYIAIKPASSSKEKVKKAIDTYISNLALKFQDDPISSEGMSEEEKNAHTASLNMLNNHLEKEIDGYYIYISSSDNEKVLKIIQENLKK
ncbi:MAG: DUF4358 domain-containing protein [Bacilli bacterium]|nr:DUF4358 domain-containing protein [Bacilli bacterium]